MSSQSRETKLAREIERVYSAKAGGYGHQALINLLRIHGLRKTLLHLQAVGITVKEESDVLKKAVERESGGEGGS